MHDFEQFDQYELLGVSRSAPPEEIKRAYRQEIAKYHPDKWSMADPASQEYARKRASAITEAYSGLRDFAQRIGPAPAEPASSVNRAERLAQMYAQAQALLGQNNAAQAVPVLRQIQQADPFYRDSADLLAQAERSLKRPAAAAAPGERRSRRGLYMALGGAGAAALIAAIYLLGGSRDNANANATATAAAVAVVTEEPTAPAV
ncbi:MAG TPA: DnaJ domain-containing protein, partial [Herpetosiphonaceae bacterium]